MTESILNFYDMSQKLSSNSIPDFVKGRFMVLKANPPKHKTLRDGLVIMLGLLSYESLNGPVDTIKVIESPSGYDIEFPRGKRGLLATKFRGPKNRYNFYHPGEQQTYRWGEKDPETGINTYLMPSYIKDYLSKKVPSWETLNEAEQEIYTDKYYEDAYGLAMAKDFNLDIESDNSLRVQVGMITDMYRFAAPPKGDERYPNITVTKFAPKEGKESLSSEYSMVDATIAAAIYDSFIRRGDTSFRPEDFVEKSEELTEGNDAFDIAA